MRRRLASVAASRRSDFSLRRRYFSTPAASSMMRRRSSGLALSTASIWPWLMITCCWRPTPESLQQLLDVEQAAGHAVDGVLAVTRPEERAGDRDLVELDREDARRVVDREAHFGPTERRALGAAGEDHIVHLLRADGGRRLCTEYPTNGVDHVGLARPVGADNDRDPRFQLERRDVCERLETLDLQRFQEHGVSLGEPCEPSTLG